ncbi:cysteine-rich CWC family protein [Pseudomonas mangiferae]|uniref:Cysteine-rich CWC family protein n=1 Tax=Pseudomonas mangiferae TaxID=2593654 RepID=A0A553H2B6_9PSED|nr:cysteine-rich CWC family protein [Pseudomonas mangiferae]TRX75905.1 cysteine-rich CWC family protein [Pseudomonas mangiferae]
MPEPVDPCRCPLCGLSNRCTQADPARRDQPCWCFETTVSPEALERVPADARNRACLCPRCAAGHGVDG